LLELIEYYNIVLILTVVVLVRFLSLRVRLHGEYGRTEKIVLKIADVLFEEFPEVIGVESVDSWDGANLRVIVSRDDPDLIDRLMESIYRIIDEHGELGNIIPEIVRVETKDAV